MTSKNLWRSLDNIAYNMENKSTNNTKPVLCAGAITEQKAVKGERCFEHFDIRPITASLYGRSADEIVDVKLAVSSNQDRPTSNDGNMDVDYWGWFDYEKNDFTLIYAKRFLLDMCFAYGINGAEGANKGMAYRLEVVS